MNDEKKVVEREIPEKLAEVIKEKEETRRKLVNEFLGVSLQKAGLARKEQELLTKLDNNTQSVQDAIKNAYNKMKLEKETEYRWQYKGNSRFIGVAVPPKPEEKK